MGKVVTLGEIMLRLSTPGNTRFVQSDSFDVVYGGGEANVALNLADNADAKMETLTELFDAAPAGNEWIGYNRFFESNIRRTGDFS